MINPLLVLDVAFTLGIFCGVCWRAKETRLPHWRRPEAVLEWVLWMSCHLLLALALLVLMGDQLTDRRVPPPVFIGAKLALATMLVFPWRRRSADT